jgi:hypothetical protein
MANAKVLTETKLKYDQSRCKYSEHDNDQTKEEGFQKYIDEFCPKYNRDDILLRLVAWIWVVFSCYKKIQYTPLLKGNSANAKFCLIRGEIIYRDKKVKDLFAKIQISECGDNMLVDNVNGYFINTIFDDHRNSIIHRKHFMTYLDSCLTCLSEDDKGISFPLEDILYNTGTLACNVNKDHLLCRLINRDPKIMYGKISFHKTITGNKNLVKYLYMLRKEGWNYRVSRDFYKKVEKLFRAIEFLGQNYGFSHNDAHLGNILYSEVVDPVSNEPADEFVLIDYGRVIFNTNAFSQELLDELDQRVGFELKKHYPAMACGKTPTYGYYQLLRRTENIKHNGFQPIISNLLPNEHSLTIDAYRFDIMTISMGILSYISKLQMQTIYNKCVYFLAQDELDKELDFVLIGTPEFIDNYLSKINKNEPEYIISQGILLFSVFIHYLYTESSKNKEDKFDAAVLNCIDLVIYEGFEMYNVNMDNLSMFGIMHTSFQILYIPHWEKFLKYYTDMLYGSNANNNAQNNAANKQNSTRTTTRVANDPNRRLSNYGGAKKLKTIVKKVSKSKFKNHMVGGNIPEEQDNSLNKYFDFEKASIGNRGDQTCRKNDLDNSSFERVTSIDLMKNIPLLKKVPFESIKHKFEILSQSKPQQSKVQQAKPQQTKVRQNNRQNN